MSNRLEQLEFKLKKKSLGFRNMLEKSERKRISKKTAKLNFRMGSKKIPQRPMSAQPAYQKSVEEELELTSR